MARPKKQKGAAKAKSAEPEAPAVAEAPQPATTTEAPTEPPVVAVPKDGLTGEPEPEAEPEAESEAPLKLDGGTIQENLGEDESPPAEDFASEDGETVPAEPKAAPKKKGPGALKGKAKGKKGDDPEADFLALVEQAKETWPGSLELGENLPIDGTPTMSTGNFGLDVATFGGLRRGRLYRFWGRPKSAKTGSALNVVEQFTSNHCARCFEHRLKCKCNGDFIYAKALYVDVEGRVADNRPWAEKHGINMKRLLFMSPKGGEEVVDACDAMLRSHAGIGLVIVDSIAQITSEGERLRRAEKGASIGRNAQLVNQALRKWVCSIVSKDISAPNKPTVILINQIRNKTDGRGCFHEDTSVMFADGSQHRIRDVVEQKLEGPVLSWDGRAIVERKITAWHDNGDLDEGEEWLTFRVAGTGGRRGAIGFTCTPKHVLVTEDGREVPAAEVKVGDKLLSWHETSLSQVEKEVIMGSLLGDGHLHATDGRDSAACLVLANQEQPDYLEWKLGFIRSLGIKRQPSANGRVAYVSNSSFELGLLRQKFYKPQTEEVDDKNYRRIPLDVIKDASLLALAIWYLDDGTYREDHRNASISVKRLDHETARQVALTLSERYPVDYNEIQQAIRFKTEDFKKFSKDIAGLVPECMAYKLLPEHRELAGREWVSGMIWNLKQIPEIGRATIGAKVLSIHTSPRKMRARRKYDITVEQNSFYVVGGDTTGVVVHNSPDVMPGGMGQGYASACDIKFTQRAAHYLKSNGKGGWDDKVVEFGDTGFRPAKDDAPNYFEIDYKITESGICPPKRWGSFNYWLRAGHGRRIGDVDNLQKVWEYAKAYKLMGSTKKGYKIDTLEARTQRELEAAFYEDVDAQERVWSTLVEKLKEPDAA